MRNWPSWEKKGDCPIICGAVHRGKRQKGDNLTIARSPFLMYETIISTGDRTDESCPAETLGFG